MHNILCSTESEVDPKKFAQIYLILLWYRHKSDFQEVDLIKIKVDSNLVVILKLDH